MVGRQLADVDPEADRKAGLRIEVNEQNTPGCACALAVGDRASTSPPATTIDHRWRFVYPFANCGRHEQMPIQKR